MTEPLTDARLAEILTSMATRDDISHMAFVELLAHIDAQAARIAELTKERDKARAKGGYL